MREEEDSPLHTMCAPTRISKEAIGSRHITLRAFEKSASAMLTNVPKAVAIRGETVAGG